MWGGMICFICLIFGAGPCASEVYALLSSYDPGSLNFFFKWKVFYFNFCGIEVRFRTLHLLGALPLELCFQLWKFFSDKNIL